jgi:uncharacterized protein
MKSDESLPSAVAPSMPRSPAATGPAAWPNLASGATVDVVKRAPDDAVAATYPATVLDAGAPPPWIALAATWTRREIDLDGLRFTPGDDIVEYFSPIDPFNVFAVFAPHGVLRGWYGNVAYPATLDWSNGRPRLTWHDLYIDLVMLPDGQLTIRDEDELAASRLATRDPALHAAILAARDRMQDLARRRAFPFHDRDRPNSVEQ